MNRRVGIVATSSTLVFAGSGLLAQQHDMQQVAASVATIVYPFAGRHAIKFGYSRGVVTESGGDFETLLGSYNLLFK